MTRNLKRLFFIVGTVCAVVTASFPMNGFHHFMIYGITVTWLLAAILAAGLDVNSGVATDCHLPWWFDVLFAGAMLTVFLMSGWWWCAGAWALILIGVCDSNSREEEA